MRATEIIPVFITILIIVSCNTSKQKFSKDEMLKIVNHQNELLGNCFKKGNIDSLALMYCDSAKLSPNGMDFVHGRDSIKAFWAEDFKTTKTLEMNTQVLTVDGNEDVIYETGKAASKLLINDSVYLAKVKYVNVWRKQKDGSYKLDIDFWNKDAKK